MREDGPITSWKTLLDRKALGLHQQIVATHVWAEKNAKGDPELIENLTRDLYGWLRDLYEHELQLAKILDEADLSLELLGPATQTPHPPISLVSGVFKKVQNRVNSVTKSIAGISERTVGGKKRRFHLPNELELGFAALTLNSAMRFGFTLPEPPTDGLFKDQDPIFLAVNKAVESIQVASLAFAEEDDEDAVQQRLSEEIDDPKLRDSTLLAVKDFSPSSSKQVMEVRIAGKGLSVGKVRPMTYATRRALNHILRSPVKETEIITLEGDVREIDLDERRFELRQISHGEINDLRCIYGKEALDESARQWLGDRLKVSGRVQRDASGRPRLMKVKHLETAGRKAGAKQTTFDFVDDDENV